MGEVVNNPIPQGTVVPLEDAEWEVVESEYRTGELCDGTKVVTVLVKPAAVTAEELAKLYYRVAYPQAHPDATWQWGMSPEDIENHLAGLRAVVLAAGGDVR